MKKSIRRLLFICAAVIIVLMGAGLTYYLPMLVMSPAGTGQLSGTGIYCVRNAINTVYFINTSSGYIMVDAGSDRPKIETSIQEIGIDKNDVKWILLTHSDYDHVASLALFPNAAIYMNGDEFPLINGTVKRSPFGGNSLPEGISVNSINSLLDGQELSFGGVGIKCIASPGHTPGSMMYLVDGRYLFSGDAFKVSKGKIGVHPYTMDAKLAKNTMERLKDTINGSSIVLTAHYGYYENPKFFP